MNEKILLIGYGFIGQNLYKKIIKTNLSITVLSPHIKEEKEKGFIRAKIQDIPFITNLNLDNTTIIHTAHVGYPLHENDTLAREVEENLNPLLILLEHIKKAKNCRLIYISSGGAIYGIPKINPVTEEYIGNPISFYGLCKKYMEEAITIYHQNYGLSYDIVRPSNVYSLEWKTHKKQGLISTLVSAIEEDKIFHLWGSGEAKKDYIHVDCVTEAIIKISNQSPSNTVFNLSLNKGFSINEVIKKIEKKYNKNIKVVHQSLKNQDVAQIILDNKKLSEYIDWKPKDFLSE